MPGARWLFCVTLKIRKSCLHFVANWKWCWTLPLLNYSTPSAKNTFSEILIRRNSPLSSLVIWKEGLREVQFWLTRHPREVKNGKIQFDYIMLMNQLLIPHNFFTWSVFNSCIIYVLIKPHGSRCWSSGQHGSLTTMRLGVRFTSLWEREVLIFQQQQTQWIESRGAFFMYSELHCGYYKMS